MTEQEVYDLAFQSVLDGEDEMAAQAFDEADKLGIAYVDLMTKGFSRAMAELGEMFSCGEIFIPEMMVSADTMQYAAGRLEEDLMKSGKSGGGKGKMVMGTVAGDVHDIGKGLVCTMLRVGGVEVYDVGRDASVDDIIAKAEEVGADVIGTSCLLTNTMREQQVLEETLRARGLRDKYKTMVGGAPVTERWQAKIGADFYGNDGVDGVRFVNRVLAEKGA